MTPALIPISSVTTCRLCRDTVRRALLRHMLMELPMIVRAELLPIWLRDWSVAQEPEFKPLREAFQ